MSMTRYHYTEQRLFEQSLDVYWPMTVREESEDESDGGGSGTEDPNVNVIFLLTVGSAWMGHQWWIYRMCSWWNSSGPKTVSSALQAPTVCIRHRGAYFQLPDWNAIFCYGILPVTAISTVCCHVNLLLPLLIPLHLLLVCFLLKLFARGSARLDDMVEDVATAIAWVRNNQDKIAPTTKNNDGTNNTRQQRQMVFGGYSSGGHVAAQLLARGNDYWLQHGLPPPEQLFSAVIYISGVLAVQPDGGKRKSLFQLPDRLSSSAIKENNDDIGVTTTTVNSSFSSSSCGGDDVPAQGWLADKRNATTTTTTTTTNGEQRSQPPTWLTDFVLRTVWGPRWRQDIPSPLAQLAHHNLPHLLIENRHELFFAGLDWLNVFFCAEQYSRRLHQSGVPNVFRQVESDHWFILASRDLHDAVREELPRLLLTTKEKTKRQQ